jgi:hypothetical protein
MSKMPIDDYIVYAVEESTLALVQTIEPVILCEIWRRLPFNFMIVRASNGKTALRVDEKKRYVWVPPSTVETLAGHPSLRATGYRWAGIVNFFSVEAIPIGSSREDAILQAQVFNAERLTRAMNKAKP